jgi:hypothetical protein
MVYHDLITGSPGLPGWCVQLLNGSGTVLGSLLTDAAGNYSFTGLPDGTYSVCEVLQSGWTQTFPAAPTSAGYTFTCPSGHVGFGPYNLAAPNGASYLWFGNN